jgi:hypothetical protein
MNNLGLTYWVALKTVFAFLVMAVSLVCTGADFPPFDYEKAKTLSPEKRRQYDLVFFNEIETWQYNTQRFPGPNANAQRKAEFQRMADDGYLPAYVAIRLLGIFPAEERIDSEALNMLIREANAGDISAMCAVSRMPITQKNWQQKDVVAQKDVREILTRFVRDGARRGHGACEADFGSWLLLGNFPGVAEDRNAAMPLLLDSAKQGYFLPASRLFVIRFLKALKKEFDFGDNAELARALCWGRLAQQHTNWTSFDVFLGLLRDYARANNRPDLMEQSYRLDPTRAPITEQAVKPEDCIHLEQDHSHT